MNLSVILLTLFSWFTVANATEVINTAVKISESLETLRVDSLAYSIDPIKYATKFLDAVDDAVFAAAQSNDLIESDSAAKQIQKVLDRIT